MRGSFAECVRQSGISLAKLTEQPVRICGRESIGGLRSSAKDWSRRLCIAGALLLAMSCALPTLGAGLEVSSPAGPRVDLAVGHGRILRLDQAAESVYIADAAIADLRVIAPDVVYVYGRKIGTTDLVAVSAQQKHQVTVQFRVIADPRPVNQARLILQPTSTEELTLFGNRVAAGGVARNIEDAVDLANAAETYSPPGQPPINDTTIYGSQQINIRVRFAEVSRTELERLGINWTAFGNTGTFAFGAGGGGDIDALVGALQRNGMLTILAEPNLTAATGRSASFLAGGEIPIPVPSGSAGQMTVQYKPFGVSLEFTPTLIKTNRIGLRVRPEVSSLSRNGAIKINGLDLPSLSVRRADTTVEVGSGQTFAIAGLFQRQMSQDFDGNPGVADFPVIGALFRSARYQRDETELVILITPYLVVPPRERSVATPLDRPVAVPPPPVPVRESHPKGPSGLVFK
jgi:pilus assembly protein CpaC